MKKIAFVVLCMMTGTFLYSQGTIIGKVKIIDGNQVPNVQVLLKQANKVVNGAYTDSLGFFQILGVQAGTYDFSFGGTVICPYVKSENGIVVSNSEVKFVNFTINCFTENFDNWQTSYIPPELSEGNTVSETVFLSSFYSNINSDMEDKRNIIVVYADSNNQLFVNGILFDITDLRTKIKDFLDIRSEGQEYPEKHFVNIPELGIIKINKNAMVVLKNDDSTLYKFYVQVLNELHNVIHELRDEFSIERFGRTFQNSLLKELMAVEKVYPTSIKIAE